MGRNDMDGGTRVLVVDDSADDRYLMKRALARAPFDYRVEEAGTTDAAHRRVLQGDIDVVLLDYHLPTRPGTWLIEQLQKLGNRAPAVVVTTASATDGLQATTLEAGAHDYCSKETVTSASLHQAVQNALVRRRIARRLDRMAARQEHLMALTAQLSQRVRLHEVFACLLEHAGEHMGAAGGGVFSLADEGRALDQQVTMGTRASSQQAVLSLPLHAPTPIAAAARERRVILARRREELTARFPMLMDLEPDTVAAIAIPCFEAQQVIAVVGLRFTEPLGDELVAYLELFGKVAADAVRRSELYERLRRQSLFEQRLLAVVGHDLRTPLATIDMGLSLMQELDSPPPEVLERVRRAARRMGDLLGDLSELTSARSGQLLRELALTDLDLGAIASETISDLVARHPERRVEAHVAAEPLIVRGAQPRLQQVLDNLVTNAVKYGDASRPITLRAGRADAGRVVLSVHNWGNPIDPELARTIFQPFTGVRKGARGGESLGLGLYIVREIVDAHGGSIDVRSAPESGTTFSVTLPGANLAVTGPKHVAGVSPRP